MFLTKKVNTLLFTGVMATSALVAIPMDAKAELSSDLTISSMYLWRGLDISDGKPAVSSTVQYDHESGFYVGSWFSSEGMPSKVVDVVDNTGTPTTDTVDIGTNGTSYEVDLYLGYDGSVGDFGYSIGYAGYFYPEAVGSISDSDIMEYILGVSYKDLSLTAYVNAEPDDFDEYKYFSLDYSIDKVGLHYAITSVDKGDGYSDFSISYALTDALSWTLSKASGDAIASDSPQEDPIIMVSYSVPLK